MKKKRKPKKSTDAAADISKNDIQRLKEVIHRLLDRLDMALMAPSKGTEKYQQHEWIFGQKTPLAETLLMLAELILKLEDADHKEDSAEAALPGAFSAADTALVDAFLARMRGHNPLPPDNSGPLCPAGSIPS